MRSDIIVIGGGASGLMAAWSAASFLIQEGQEVSVTVLEKMPKPGRKIMITGKGRCNYTNLKDWESFASHIRSHPNTVKNAFFNLTPQSLIDFFASYGMPSSVERGDRVFPESMRSSSVIDTLVNACNAVGVRIITDSEVTDISAPSEGAGVFSLSVKKGETSETWIASSLIIATGGLSYPDTGSTGDGYRFAEKTGHSLVPLFPSLTALVPKGYKQCASKGHIDRSTPLAVLGEKLRGVQLKNITVQLLVEGNVAESAFGDIDFTDGGLEGPVGFQISRKAVKSIVNGARTAVCLDLKPAVQVAELASRLGEVWSSVETDRRSLRLAEKEKVRIFLGKLMPWELIPSFVLMNPDVLYPLKTEQLAERLKNWKFDIDGYVGYERAVVTAGGVNTSDIISKTLESHIVKNLYFCGEVLDIDADTGGYNLHSAFCTGSLAGRSAAASLPEHIS